MGNTIEDNFMTLASRMADTAGGIARGYFQKPIEVDDKADASPVTIVDREIESTLRAMIGNAYPEHGIIGEEYGSIHASAEYQWVIDPIDGTRAFIAGLPTFTTLIALAKGGVPLLGIIIQPLTSERWIGEVGKPATQNGKAIAVRDCTDLSQAEIASTSMDYFTPVEKEKFMILKSQCAKTQLGGDAYAYGMLASGKMDIVLDAHMKPYDFCALKPVVEGAGGIITDWSGEPLTIHSDGNVLAAGNEELHKLALAILTK